MWLDRAMRNHFYKSITKAAISRCHLFDKVIDGWKQEFNTLNSNMFIAKIKEMPRSIFYNIPSYGKCVLRRDVHLFFEQCWEIHGFEIQKHVKYVLNLYMSLIRCWPFYVCISILEIFSGETLLFEKRNQL